MGMAKARQEIELEKITREFLVKGFLPGNSAILNALNERLGGRALSAPTLNLRQFAQYENELLPKMNATLREIAADLSFLHTVQIEDFIHLMRLLSLNESQYRANRYRLLVLKDYLEGILATTKNAGGYFHAFTDKFNDLRMIDVRNSSIDVFPQFKIATLAQNKQATKRIHMAHLLERKVFITPENPDYFTVTNVPGSISQNAFDNRNSIWQVRAVGDPRIPDIADTTTPVKFFLRFPVVTSDDPDATLGRIDIEPVSPSRISILPKFSIDNTNYMLFSNYSQSVESDSEPITFRTSATKVRYLLFEITKFEPDEFVITSDGTQAPVYIIGFKDIALFAIGYAGNGTLYSKPLIAEITANDSVSFDSLGEISLISDETIMQDTQLKYSVAMYDKNVDPNPALATLNWKQIVPLMRSAPAEQQRVDFGGIAKSPITENIISGSTSAYATINGRTLYDIGRLDDTIYPLFGTGKLWYGLNGWMESASVEKTRIQVQNVALKLSPDHPQDTISIPIRDEWAERVDPGGITDIPALHTTHGVDVKAFDDGSTMFSSGIIKHSVQRLAQNGVQNLTRIAEFETSSGVALSNCWAKTGAWRDLRQTSFISWPNDKPRYCLWAGAKIKINYPGGTFGEYTVAGWYPDLSRANSTNVQDPIIIAVYDQGGTLDGNINSSGEWIIKCNQEDLTSLVKDVVNNEIRLAHIPKMQMTNSSYPEKWLISYYGFLDPEVETIIPESLILSDKPGAYHTDYSAPEDYIISDAVFGVIERSPNSKIGTQDDPFVIANFTYETNLPTFYVYNTNFYLERYLEEIKFTSPSLNIGEGEAFVISGPVGTFDLTSSDTIPPLTPGVYKVTIKSRDPLHTSGGIGGTINTNSAIYKVINLVDLSGNYIFSVGHNFTKMRLTKEPLQQATVHDLAYNVSDPRSHFALERDPSTGTGQIRIVVSFCPG